MTDTVCDKCPSPDCASCMMRRPASEDAKIKELISRRLTSFLLSRRARPNEIRIFVEYPLSTAILSIDGAEIGEVLEE